VEGTEKLFCEWDATWAEAEKVERTSVQIRNLDFIFLTLNSKIGEREKLSLPRNIAS
jgi:DTW domain-containing protein YfiP